jgi:hypothetical protein
MGERDKQAADVPTGLCFATGIEQSLLRRTQACVIHNTNVSKFCLLRTFLVPCVEQ